GAEQEELEGSQPLRGLQGGGGGQAAGSAGHGVAFKWLLSGCHCPWRRGAHKRILLASGIKSIEVLPCSVPDGFRRWPRSRRRPGTRTSPTLRRNSASLPERSATTCASSKAGWACNCSTATRAGYC